MNFYSAAFTYLYEWIYYDRHYMKVLACSSNPEPNPAEACEQLIGVATHYNVMRGFRLEEEGITRFLPVWDALRGMSRPSTDEEAIERVGQLVQALRTTYNQNLQSVASKILWMRFQSPVAIYDSLTSKWMSKNGGCSNSSVYSDFYYAWHRHFSEHETEIRTVCTELEALSAARKFFDPGDIGQQAFHDAVSSRWFAERVFDHALLNAETIERSTVPGQ